MFPSLSPSTDPCLTKKRRFSVTDVIDYYHLADDKEGNPVFSLDVRPAVDDLGAVKERVEEWWKLKKESLFGGSPSPGDGTPGVRVQEN